MRLVSDVSEQMDDVSTTLRIESSSEDTLLAPESLVSRGSPALSTALWKALPVRTIGMKSLRSDGAGIPGGRSTVGHCVYVA